MPNIISLNLYEDFDRVQVSNISSRKIKENEDKISSTVDTNTRLLFSD